MLGKQVDADFVNARCRESSPSYIQPHLSGQLRAGAGAPLALARNAEIPPVWMCRTPIWGACGLSLSSDAFELDELSRELVGSGVLPVLSHVWWYYVMSDSSILGGIVFGVTGRFWSGSFLLIFDDPAWRLIGRVMNRCPC